MRNNADDDVFVVDLAAGSEPEHITPHEGDVSHGVQTFTPDSSALYYTSDAGGEFARVWSFDLESGEAEIVEEADWDIRFVSFSWDGRYRTMGINVDGQTEISVIEVGSGEAVELPAVPAGDVTSVRYSRDGSRIAFAASGDTAPTNLFVLDRGSGDLNRLTMSLNPEVDEMDLVSSELIRYPSFDELEIPGPPL